MKTARIIDTHQKNSILLAIEQDKLETLISQGKLHVSDFNCLDKTSKRRVWRMLLAVAARTLHS